MPSALLAGWLGFQGGNISPKVWFFQFHAGPFAVPLAIALLALTGCSSSSKPPARAATAPAQQSTAAPPSGQAPPTLDTTDAGTTKQTTALALPKNFGRATGDWDQIVKRGALRVLVVNNRTGFFYDKGRPRGATTEAL